ncbi:MAG TPA: phage holin family protein [Candidatus Paceibacterota bacterium]|nr:phage holin family protein [Candidatus Paceibacterota bacterium]
MIQMLLLHILAGIGGLWIAVRIVDGVEFTGPAYLLLIIGLVLGILNAIVKPVLDLITLPIRILTLGLSSILINLGLVWALQLVFPELEFEGFLPLLWTTLIIVGITIPLSVLSRGKI